MAMCVVVIIIVVVLILIVVTRRRILTIPFAFAQHKHIAEDGQFALASFLLRLVGLVV
jgi:hypothetical protein